MARITAAQREHEAFLRGKQTAKQEADASLKLQQEHARVEALKALTEVATANAKISYSLMMALNGKQPFNG